MTTAETRSRERTTAGPERGGVGRLRRRPHRWGVGAIAVLTGVLQAALGVQQYRDFYLGGYDLAIFDQAVRDYAHGDMPVSTFKNVHDAAQVAPGYGHVFSILGDHFSPILALLAPLYWIWNNPVVLLLAQAALFAAAVPSVWLFARRALRRIVPERAAVAAAYAVALAYGISWPLQMASQAGFHEVGFFTLLSAIMIERVQAGRLRPAVFAALAMLFVKEDTGFVVAAFGLMLLVVRSVNGVRLEPGALRRHRRTGAGLIAVGVGVALAAQDWWLPAFGGRPGFYWYYGQLGPDLHSALWKILSDPVYAFHVATTPGAKVHTFFLLLWPVLFCCLLSPISLLAVPLLAERAFSSKPEHWALDQHYNAFLAAILLTAGVDGAVRLRELIARARARARRPADGNEAPARPGSAGRFVRVWTFGVVAAALAFTALRPMPLYRVFDPGAWTGNAFIAAENRAVATVPSGVCVEADNDIAPHLVSRTQVLLLDEVPRGCPWVVLQTANVSYPFSGPAAEQARADWLAANGYRLVFSSTEVFVYRRP